MKPKKNPKIEFGRNNNLYFLSGLALVLLLVFIALEWKSYLPEPAYDTTLNIVDELNEEVVVLKKLELPKPKEIPVKPQEIEIIDDDLEIEESLIDKTEPGPEENILEPNDIVIMDIDDDDPIPFAIIEEVPVFPGCEDAIDRRECFNVMIQKHILRNFRYPESAQEMGIQGKVTVMFTITKDGFIDNIRYRGPAEILEQEALRIVKKLPQMIPGKQRGSPVDVPFSIPINFKLH